MDKKGVHLLSNYHDPSEVTTVYRKQKGGMRVQVDCPIMGSDYNKYMGFVDNADRLLSTYNIDRKSEKCWHRLYWHFIDLTIGNSFIIFTKINNDSSVTLKKFRLFLVDQLVSHKIPIQKGRKRQPSLISRHKPQVPLEKRRSESAHIPAHIEDQRRIVICSTGKNNVRTRWICKTCNVPLCLQADRNYFLKYHS